MWLPRPFLLLVISGVLWLPSCQASVACSLDYECESMLQEGSQCLNGFCTNPFYNGGCLKRMLPGWNKLRTCTSEDPIDAAEKGYCRSSPLGYQEVRISSQNWASVFFSTWILQILLSEMLDVPTTVETGMPDVSVDFYNINSSFDYGKANDVLALENSARYEDCRLLKRNDDDSTQYQSCAHLIPELWPHGKAELIQELRDKRVIEPLENVGTISQLFWFVPKFTAERDPTLTSYLGLQGKHNRRKLAETFLRPTTWRDYCKEVSMDDCQTDDGVAVRPPIDETEGSSFFAEGLYTGHFRATEKNDCYRNPTNCTGFFADHPCGWVSFAFQQSYHNDIALEVIPFSYREMMQIYSAANATRSDIISYFWTTDPEYHILAGTDFEMTPVALPRPTQVCLDHRVETSCRCGCDFEKQIGDPRGACADSPELLKKMIGTALYKISRDPDIQEALWSPAYDAVKNYQISDLQFGEMFRNWLQRGVDTWNYDARDAACRWVVENFDTVQSFMPESYPRSITEQNIKRSGVYIGAVVAAALATIFVLAGAFFTHQRRKKMVMYHAQVEFIFLLLSGMFLVAVGSLLLTLPPSDLSCISTVWIINIGYVIFTTSIVVKLDAVNRLVSSGKSMQRARLEMKQLLRPVLIAISLTVAYLVVWTVIDAPKKGADHKLTQDLTENGETIVMVMNYCDSESQLWILFSVLVQSVLLLCALVLGILASRVREDMNGAKNLTILTLSHCAFFVFQGVAVFISSESVQPSALMLIQSLIFSGDCIVALSVFVLPKLLEKSEDKDSAEPLPDYFLNTTIMVADITGFTKWSSMREPVQVFKFLDVVVREFDEVAEKREVLKIQTVGDSYVAATGIPRTKKDHAVAMGRFAIDCMTRMHNLTKELEILFGPDTGDLSLRIGMHSGPVTGGCLHGKGASFQLFGDTMNTASRMESTGKRGCIQLSEDTANLFVKTGKGHWIQKREDMVQAKGKGELQTYWLRKTKKSPASEYSCEADDCASSTCESDNRISPISPVDEQADRTQRLIDWNVEVLCGLLRQIIAQRKVKEKYGTSVKTNLEFGRRSEGSITRRSRSNSDFSDHQSGELYSPVSSLRTDPSSSVSEKHTMPLDEVKEIITLPDFNRKAAYRNKDVEKVEVPAEVLNELKLFVTAVAERYRDNPFHNFAHASHVVMAVIKHMNRIIAPTNVVDDKEHQQNDKKAAATLHDHTYGITSDPLTQFACIFSALIHDLDHPGVPNPQLIKEDEHLAALYKGRSVAEQNSFDIAWELLMNQQFDNLRRAIGSNNTELARFRQLVINSVMATDLGDKELKVLRNSRWEKAFSAINKNCEESSSPSGARDAVNRKATIVIEHLIQAADVSHTMQHWHVYIEWNERLFRELYKAYQLGREVKNPADLWYQGELGFFDFYIIPLSKKLAECGVFGLSSDENLNYATKNRAEWAAKGKEVIAEYLKKIQREDKEEGTGDLQMIEEGMTMKESERY